MKKYEIYILTILIGLSVFALGFNYKDNKEPNTYYQVYLDSKVIGTITSKEKLLKMIDNRGNYIKKKYHTNKVYEPNGLQIKKVTTYHDKLSDEKEVYQKIAQERPFTIRGYQLTIKNGKNNIKYYATEEKLFKNALQDIVKIYVGEEKYNAYMQDNQKPITTTGSIVENVYFDNDMTIKSMNIPVTSNIYTDNNALSKILLFGEKAVQTQYKVQSGDTIESVAFKNKISVDEFLISNPTFSSSKNLLFPGQEVTISQTNPQVRVVVEEHVVKDIVSQYKTEERYDDSKPVGDDTVIQAGENGLERVTQKQKTINGVLNYVDPKGKEVLKPTINRIVEVGSKIIPSVGTTAPGTWAWPTNSGYTISSDFQYRINPVTGGRELHTGIDISGTGYGSPIYAANNGVVYTASYRTENGYYVTINHNNGYYTLYAHMSRYIVREGQVVSKGQIIGYVGQSGYATGPHLHFELWVGGSPWRGALTSPWVLY